jgi:hypothetical protein
LFLLTDILLYAAVSAALTFAISYLWGWSKQHYRFAVISVSTFLGFAAWNVLQSATGADQALNIDWPVFPLSWSDFGSGVAAFAVTSLVLGLLTERGQPAGKVMMAATLAGALAALVDLFAL